MSVTGEINAEMYRQMTELQDKLKQSEAERMRLEEMFNVLIKTFKEEECVHLKNLEGRYHSFLEDCARRSDRNEKILRTLERVESGANVLYAKTERLRLLRNHYEAYLERIIPTWRQQPSPVRYGLGHVTSEQEIGRRQLIPEGILEPSRAIDSVSRIGRYYSSPSQYFPNDELECKQMSTPFSSTNGNHRKYINYSSRDPELRIRSTDGYDGNKASRENYYFRATEYRNDVHTGPLHSRLDERIIDNMDLARRLDTTFCSKIGEERGWNLVKQIYETLRDEENSEQSWQTLPEKLSFSKQSQLDEVDRKEGNGIVDGRGVNRRRECFSDGMDTLERKLTQDSPLITREPVEIKKPEFIVGKLHPEATSKFEYLKKFSDYKELLNKNKTECNSSESSFVLNEDKLQQPENTKTEVRMKQPEPSPKWNLLKHKKTIDKLKETMSYEDACRKDYEDDVRPPEGVETETVNHVSHHNIQDEACVRAEVTDSQNLSEGWQDTGEGRTSQRLDAQTNFAPDVKAELIDNLNNIKITEENDYESQIPEHMTKEDVCDSNEGVFEDNEDAYPESYYEQPPQTSYSRNIVSNVILEEDESEINANDEGLELTQRNTEQRIRGKKDGQLETAPVQGSEMHDEYNLYNSGLAQEMKEKEDEFQNLCPDDQSYNEGDRYRSSSGFNGIQPQEEYICQNPEMNSYNSNSEFEGNTGVEQYQIHTSQEQYYNARGNEELGNYTPDQGTNFQGNPSFDFYKNSAVWDNQEGYNQEEMVPEGEYFNQRESDVEYYQQSEGFLREQQNLDFSATTGFQDGKGESAPCGDAVDHLPLRQSNLAHLLESDSESFQMEHGSTIANEDSDFDFSMGQQ